MNSTDVQLEKLFELAFSEEDLALRSSMLHEIIGQQGISQDLLLKASQTGNNSVSRRVNVILDQTKHPTE